MEQKIYLKSVEEISDTLSKGITVYFDNTKQDLLTKDRNGMLILENKEGKKLCVGCCLGMEDKPYVLELKVEPFRLYENKDGDRVIIYRQTGRGGLFIGFDFSKQKAYYYDIKGKSKGVVNPDPDFPIDNTADLHTEIANLAEFLVKGYNKNKEERYLFY